MAKYNQHSQFSLLNNTPKEIIPKSRITEIFNEDKLLTSAGKDFSLRNSTEKLKQMLSEEKFNLFYNENRNAIFQVIHAIGWMDNESQQYDLKKRWPLLFTLNKEKPISIFNFVHDPHKLKLLNQFSEILDSSSKTRCKLVEIDNCIMEMYRQIPRVLYDFNDLNIPFNHGFNDAKNFIKSIVDNARAKSTKFSSNTSSTKSKICNTLLLNEAINHVSQIIENFVIGYSNIDFEFHPYKDAIELFHSDNHIDDDKLLNSALESYKKKFSSEDITTFKRLANLIFAIHYYDRGTKTVPRDTYSHDPHMKYIVYCFIICCKKNKLKLSLNNSGFGSRPVNIYNQLVKILRKCNNENPYDYIDKHYYEIEQQLTKYILNIISWLCRLYEIPSLRKGCSFEMYMNIRKMTWETVLYTYDSLFCLPFDTAIKMIDFIKNEYNRYLNATTIRQRRMIKRANELVRFNM